MSERSAAKYQYENTGVYVGANAPDFELKTAAGSLWRLSDQIGKVTVLLFYPKNETLVCTRQLCSVRDNWEDYLRAKVSIAGISKGTIERHRKFSNDNNLPLPLLADEDGQITRLYCRPKFVPLSFTRAVFVIDAKGIVRNRDIMLRIFRPSDQDILSSIRAAKAEIWIHSADENVLNEQYEKLMKN